MDVTIQAALVFPNSCISLIDAELQKRLYCSNPNKKLGTICLVPAEKERERERERKEIAAQPPTVSHCQEIWVLSPVSLAKDMAISQRLTHIHHMYTK